MANLEEVSYEGFGHFLTSVRYIGHCCHIVLHFFMSASVKGIYVWDLKALGLATKMTALHSQYSRKDFLSSEHLLLKRRKGQNLPSAISRLFSQYHFKGFKNRRRCHLI